MYLCLVLTNTGLDIRLPPTVDLNSFMQQLDTWVAEEGKITCNMYLVANIMVRRVS